MKLASSTRLGGILISADECDYNDYRRFFLHCPECDAPVFLRAGSTYTNEKGTLVKRSPHFFHSKAADPALVQQCELRVGGYSPQDLKQKAKESKQQRLKILQKDFVQMLVNSTNFPLKRSYWKPNLPEKELLQAGAKRKIIEKVKNKLYKMFKKEMISRNFRIEEMMHDVEARHQESNILKGPSKYDEYMKSCLGVDRRLHCLVTEEVLYFLGTPRNSKLAQGLFLEIARSVIHYTAGLRGMEFDDTAAAYFLNDNWQKVCEVAYDSVIFFLAQVNWVEEFSKIQKREN